MGWFTTSWNITEVPALQPWVISILNSKKWNKEVSWVLDINPGTKPQTGECIFLWFGQLLEINWWRKEKSNACDCGLPGKYQITGHVIVWKTVNSAVFQNWLHDVRSRLERKGFWNDHSTHFSVLRPPIAQLLKSWEKEVKCKVHPSCESLIYNLNVIQSSICKLKTIDWRM